MRKIEIKSIRVMVTVMILLNFSQADDVTEVYYCNFKCRMTCLVESPALCFEKCVKECESSQCSKLSSDLVYNCITGCRLMNSLVINIGMYSKIFSCFEVLYFISKCFISVFFFSHDFDN
ncbi:hypothetical protein V8G54_023353 [Vigna mungo]|uniref:Thionin-like protein n=1 Tax=Vigna mungo TaxID=3915 RepID=A0AAQ3N481_VIGMU